MKMSDAFSFLSGNLGYAFWKPMIASRKTLEAHAGRHHEGSEP
ncbi:MAG: hypothetical protein VX346_14685 [Planctomycetota bacterium]|nr:hypothetical protein [Planctomycetota bacterium]